MQFSPRLGVILTLAVIVAGGVITAIGGPETAADPAGSLATPALEQEDAGAPRAAADAAGLTTGVLDLVPSGSDVGSADSLAEPSAAGPQVAALSETPPPPEQSPPPGAFATADTPAAPYPDGNPGAGGSGAGTPPAPGETATDAEPAGAAAGPPDSAREARRRVIHVPRGATLLSLLGDQGVGRADAHAMVDALETAFNPRRLRAGQEITLLIDRRDGAAVITGFEVAPTADATLAVSADGAGGFAVNRIEHDLDTRPVAAGGPITSSLYAAADGGGVPAPVILDVIRLWSHSVDFQRDLQPGDRFELLYEHDVHPDGRVARNGDVLYAALTLSDRELVMHRFQARDGSVDYYDREGHSVRRALLRTPIDGARLSSGFGLRLHPVLGYTRMHRGVDFAAPPGTPIFAAGDGTVELAGAHAGYGLYVRLRHNGHTATAYGHMSRIAPGMAAGRRVSQGEVIGYVGSTGLATGPHLHYEVLVDGTQVDPVGVDRRIGRNLEGRDLAAFRRAVQEHERRYAALRRDADLVAESAEDASPRR